MASGEEVCSLSWQSLVHHVNPLERYVCRESEGGGKVAIYLGVEKRQSELDEASYSSPWHAHLRFDLVGGGLDQHCRPLAGDRENKSRKNVVK